MRVQHPLPSIAAGSSCRRKDRRGAKSRETFKVLGAYIQNAKRLPHPARAEFIQDPRTDRVLSDALKRIHKVALAARQFLVARNRKGVIGIVLLISAKARPLRRRFHANNAAGSERRKGRFGSTSGLCNPAGHKRSASGLRRCSDRRRLLWLRSLSWRRRWH